MQKPDLFPEEKLLSYSKYYYIEPDPFNPLATQIIRKPLDEKDVLWPDRVEEMFKPGYQEAMFGYYIFDSGSYTSFYAQLHGVKTEMIDWFFVWMCIPPISVPREHGNLRYKLWVPVDHYDHYPDDEWSEKRLKDDSIPYKLRRQGIHDAAIESIDLGKSGVRKHLHMHLAPPTILSLPKECWDYINAIGTINVFSSDHSVNLQFFRNTSYWL